MNTPTTVFLTLLCLMPVPAVASSAEQTPRTTRGRDEEGWTHLVYVKPLSYSVGFGRLEWYRGGEQRITIGGKPFGLALYAHATSSIKYELAGKSTEFQTCYGLKAGAGGAAVFVIVADGKELFRTGEIYGYGHTHDDGIKNPIKLDITGVKTLELKAIGVRGGASAWSCWGDPKVR